MKKIAVLTVVTLAFVSIAIPLPLRLSATTTALLDPDRIVDLPTDIDDYVECGDVGSATCAVTITLNATSTVYAMALDLFWELEDPETEEVIYYDDGVVVVEESLGGQVVRQAPGVPCEPGGLVPRRLHYRRFSSGITLSDFVVQQHIIIPPDCAFSTALVRIATHRAARQTQIALDSATPSPTPWPVPTSPCQGCSTPDECPGQTATSCNVCPGSSSVNPLIDYSCYGCGFGSFAQVIEGVVDRNINPAYKQFFMTGKDAGAGFVKKVFYTTCEDTFTFLPTSTVIISPGLANNLCPAKRFTQSRAACNSATCGETQKEYASGYEDQIRIMVRDANPGTLLHEMFHAFLLARYSDTEILEMMECAKTTVMDWVQMCSRLTYPSGPDGPNTYSSMCKDMSLAAISYGSLPSSPPGSPLFVEEMLGAILATAASCNGGQGCRNIPPDLVAVYAMLDEFLACSVGKTPLTCP